MPVRINSHLELPKDPKQRMACKVEFDFSIALDPPIQQRLLENLLTIFRTDFYCPQGFAIHRIVTNRKLATIIIFERLCVNSIS